MGRPQDRHSRPACTLRSHRRPVRAGGRSAALALHAVFFGTVALRQTWARAPMLWCALLVLLAPRPARAIRPFVTDDARVVGGKLAQVETWLLADRFVIEHNILGAIGPTDWLELTVGLIHGGVHSGPDRGYSLTGPLLQLKELLLAARNNRWPGIALAAGVIPPLGEGPFTPAGWGGFAYLALTESLLDEWLLVHTNLGVAFAEEGPAGESSPPPGRRLRTLVTAGLGVQARVVAGLHGVAEVYYGDPYDPHADFPAVQVGFRYIFNDQVQLDGTFGSTLTALEAAGGHAQTEQWGTLGIRLVSPELW